jgi:hypothetical protein
MEAPQAQWLWPCWREKKQGKKALGGLKTLKVSNNFGPAGRRNPPRASKFDGEVCKSEFAGRTPSPHKKAQGKEASFLYRPNREKAFVTAKGRRDVKAEAVAKDDSDDDEGASVGRPLTGRDPNDPADWAGDRRKTRAIKGGRSAVVGTVRPKAGQDLDDPADRAGDGLPKARPAKVPPKNGHGVPVEIVNEDGLSSDEVSFTSKDEFASKEGDNKRNPDDDIAAAAQLALGAEGLRPSNEARATVARLPGAVIVQRALAALRDNTNNEASSAAVSNSKVAAQAILRDGMEPNKEADFKANWQAKKGGHTREEAGRATKRKPNHAAHQGGGTRSPQVLTANEEANFEAKLEGRKGGLPEWRGRLGHQEEGRPRGPPGRWDVQPPSVGGVVWFHRGKKIRGKPDRAEALPIFYPTIATKHDEPDDRTDQRLYGSHGKAEEPKAPAKGRHGHKIASHGKDGSDGNEIARVGTTKPALIRALAAATVRGKVSARRGDGGVGMYPDDSITAAARFAPGAMGRMPDNKAKAELECLTGAEVMRRALAALHEDTNEEAERYDDNKEEPSSNGDDDDDGFIVTKDNDTEDNKTLGGEAHKVQRASSRKACQQTHKEAHLFADRGCGTLGLASDGKDGKTQNSKARPGRRAVKEDRNARAPEARQGSRASDTSKSHQKTKETAHHPAYWGSGMHRRALEGEDKKDWAPKAMQAEDAEAWVQAEEASYAQKKSNHAAHQGGGTRSPLGRTALLGLAALFRPATSGKIRGKPDRA